MSRLRRWRVPLVCLGAGLVLAVLHHFAWPLVWHGLVLPGLDQARPGLELVIYAQEGLRGRELSWSVLPSAQTRLERPFASQLVCALWRVPRGGDWELRLEGDDFGRLLLDRRQVIALHGLSAHNQGQTRLRLAAGPHLLEMELNNYQGGGWMRLSAQGPGQAKMEPLAPDQFWHPDLSLCGLRLARILGQAAKAGGALVGLVLASWLLWFHTPLPLWLGSVAGLLGRASRAWPVRPWWPGLAVLLLVLTGLAWWGQARQEAALQAQLAGGQAGAGLRAWSYQDRALLHRPARVDRLTALDLSPGAPGWFGRPNSGLRLAGTLRVSRPGLYQLGLISQDGSRLWLDGQLVVDHWGFHGPLLGRGQARLSAGPHSFYLEQFNGVSQGSLQVLWTPPGESLHPLPAAVLSPAPAGLDWGAWLQGGRRGRWLGAAGWLALGLALAALLAPGLGSLGRAARALPAWLRRQAPLLLILLAGVALRTAWISSVAGLEGDEAWFGFTAHTYLRGAHPHLPIAGMNPYTGPPFLYLLMGVQDWLGPGIWSLRLPGVLFNSLALVLGHDLVRRHLGRGPALAACALWACLPALVGFERTAGEITALNPFLLAAGAWCLWAPARRWTWSLLGGSLWGLGAYNHLILLPVPLALGLAALLTSRRGAWRDFWARLLPALAGSAPWLYLLGGNLLRGSQDPAGMGMAGSLWAMWSQGRLLDWDFARLPLMLWLTLDGREVLRLLAGPAPWNSGPWLGVLLAAGALGLTAGAWRPRPGWGLVWLGLWLGASLGAAWLLPAWLAGMVLVGGGALFLAAAPTPGPERYISLATWLALAGTMVLVSYKADYFRYHLLPVGLLALGAGGFWGRLATAPGRMPAWVGRGGLAIMLALSLSSLGVDYFHAHLHHGGALYKGKGSDFATHFVDIRPLYAALAKSGCARVRASNHFIQMPLLYLDLERNHLVLDPPGASPPFGERDCLVYYRRHQFYFSGLRPDQARDHFQEDDPRCLAQPDWDARFLILQVAACPGQGAGGGAD